MNFFLDLAAGILTVLFFVGLAGASMVAVLFLADLFRTISRSEGTRSDQQPFAG